MRQPNQLLEFHDYGKEQFHLHRAKYSANRLEEKHDLPGQGTAAEACGTNQEKSRPRLLVRPDRSARASGAEPRNQGLGGAYGPQTNGGARQDAPALKT
jgi:hypothetical protein